MIRRWLRHLFARCEFCRRRRARGTAIIPVTPYTVRLSCGHVDCGLDFIPEVRR